MTKYYAGIGSRSTPKNVLLLMEQIAEKLARHGWLLRSGGAQGADTAFEMGCDRAQGKKQIFRPAHCEKWCIEEASRYQPVDRPPLKRMKEYTQKLIGRDMKQILGPDGKSPSKVVICYTPDGKDSGGTGWALRCAMAHKIPIYNLHDEETRKRLERFIENANKVPQ